MLYPWHQVYVYIYICICSVKAFTFIDLKERLRTTDFKKVAARVCVLFAQRLVAVARFLKYWYGAVSGQF